MTASVQNLEPAAAYLPPAQSNGSPDKKSGTADCQGQPSDFHSELELQNTSKPGAKSPARPETVSSGTGKKPAARDAEDPKLAAVTPVQVAEPPKIILPVTLVLGLPEEHAEEASPQKPSQENAAAPALDLQGGQIASHNVTAPVAQPANFAQTPAPDAASESKPELKAALKLPESTPLKPEPVPAVPETTNSEPSVPPVLAFAARVTAAPSNQSDAAVQERKYQLSTQPDQSGAAAPESKPQPPVVSTARVTAAQPAETNAAAPVAQGQQAPALSDAPTAVRIPARYAAIAPVLQKTEKELDPQVDLKKFAGPAPDRAIHSGAVLARVESGTGGNTGGFQSQPAPHTEPAPRVEKIIEPPAAPATSPNDIRVRVPDNNGGSTQVRFVESGGEVRISVRTADAGLAQNLRTHLNDLSQRLADGGTPVEMWKPGADTAQSQNDHRQPDREGRGSGGQQPGSQERQQDQQGKRPAWLEEMEASLQDKSA